MLWEKLNSRYFGLSINTIEFSTGNHCLQDKNFIDKYIAHNKLEITQINVVTVTSTYD